MAGSSSLDFDSAAEEEAALLSASITDEQLHVLTGTHELSTVRFLQMAVDSEFVPLNCLGDRLPALEQLKLNGSCLPSLRHLGTSLCQVRVLWLCRCGLQELDNLGALPELQELYLAFNDIRQLSPLVESDQLQVLDLEANLVSDMEQVEFLQLGPSLQELTLRGNPIAERVAFRNEVLAMLPHLLFLDDELPDSKEGNALSLAALGLDAELDEGVMEGELAAEASFVASRLNEMDEDGCSQRGGSSRYPPSPPRTTAALSTSSSSGMRSPAAPHTSVGVSSPRSSTVGKCTPACVRLQPAPLEGEAARREEMLVSRGIKYAEVGRVYDVAADGRQILTSAGGSRGRPSSAAPLVNTWTSDGVVGAGARPTTAIGSFSRPLSSAGVSRPISRSTVSRPMSISSLSRPISALGSTRLLNYAGSSRSLSTASFSHNLLASPTRPHDELAEDSAASDLTSSTDIICGVHKLRAHKLRRDVQSMGALASGSGEGGEANGLDEELMDQLRAVKIQQLLAGDDLKEASDEARSEDSDGVEEAALGVGRDMRLLSEEAEAEEAAQGCGRLVAGGVADTYQRPTSSKDVTPTPTPAGAESTMAVGSRGLSATNLLLQPASSHKKGLLGSSSSRISASRAQGTLPVLRHLRMPADESPADILQLS